MSASGGAENHPAFGQQIDSHKRRAARRRRPPEDLAEHRIPVDANAKAPPHLLRGVLMGLGLDYRFDIVRVVEARQLLRARQGAVDIVRLVKPSKRANQVERRGIREGSPMGACRRIATAGRSRCR